MDIGRIIAYSLINPLVVGLVLLLGAALWKRARAWLVGGAAVWLYFWSTGVCFRMLGKGLEGAYPPIAAEALPSADAIVELGGGIGRKMNGGVPNLYSGADRVCFAARLWKAGKAPIVVPSCIGAEDADAEILQDFGIPKEAIVIENEALTTEENAKRIVRLFDCSDCSIGRLSTSRWSSVSGETTGNKSLQSDQSKNPTNRTIRILLVTSAWHMRRSVLLFEKYAPEVEVVPAPTDHDATIGCVENGSWWHLSARDFVPDPGAMTMNMAFAKEYLGYFIYKYLK